ncbi:MAG: amidohydrolase family protein [Zoogloeaceae bacterium]|jgi:mannonate dehydratase|nr:amidohydrolase family protein [Zoogloeaceae bacterium]
MAWLFNPCHATLPESLRASPWLARVWQGLAPEEVWDCHVHLAGLGDHPQSGIVLGPKFSTPLHPFYYLQRLFYINAACSKGADCTVDENYARRLVTLMEDFPPGVKLLLFAFDYLHDEAGRPQAKESAFYIPDDYARRLAEEYPQYFAWAASIHPYRPDALERLEKAIAGGAAAVKWLPAAQRIDPASPLCDAFFALLARHDLPLIVHCGKEEAVQTRYLKYGNPLRLRRALEAGARIVVAHCATTGKDEDFDHPSGAGTSHCSSFALFARLMDEPAWRGRLFGDISAITLRNRRPAIIRTLLERADWHPRLLNGSDYPLPGIIPLVSPASLARAGLLPREATTDLETLRNYNPLYFDLAVKRLLSWRGQAFPETVFATRAFFQR